MYGKAQLLSELLDQHRPHQRPGHANRPPVSPGKGSRRGGHPLDNMFRRGVIDEGLYVAGLRFRSDWELAHVNGEGTIDWDRFAPPPGIDEIDELAFRRPSPKPVRRPPSGVPAARYDAKQTLARLRVVTGSFGFQLLRGICVYGIPLVHIAEALKLHRDYVSLRLREALDEAAVFYGEIIDANEE